MARTTATDNITVEAPKVEVVKQTIYCGPNLPGGILPQYTVFKGEGLPIYVQEIAKKYPAIEKAIVPIERFSDFMVKLNDKTSVEFSFIKELTKQLKGE